MFEIGFWEMALIALVALLIVGPKELPAMLRNVSSWVRRAREFAGEFKNELSREVAEAEELKRLIERESEVAEFHKLLDETRATIPLDNPPDGAKEGGQAPAAVTDSTTSTPKPDQASSGESRRDGQTS